MCERREAGANRQGDEGHVRGHNMRDGLRRGRGGGVERELKAIGVAGLAARTRTRLGLCPSDFRLGKADKACEELVSSWCEARALALEVRLRRAGEQVLESEGEGTNTNGGGRRKLTGGPILGLPPVPSWVVVERSAAG
jgi:hypothetical protein